MEVLDTNGFDDENHGRFDCNDVSPDVHDQWSAFLAARGFSVADEAGAARAVAPPVNACTAATRCVDLNHFAALHLLGVDAITFLQGYVTCDLAQLTDDTASWGAYCNIKGRVVADLTIAIRAGNPLLLLHASLRDAVAASLQKYLAFARSRFAPIDSATVLLGVINPPTARGVRADPMAVTSFHDGVAIGVPGSVPRVMLALPFDDAAAVWREFESGAQTDDAAAWDLLDVRSRIVHINAATSAAFLPQMLEYDTHGAISFSKGCYLGQEVVARTQHLGRPKRHLHALRYTGAAPPPGTPLAASAGQQRAGTLVGIAATGGDSGEALAVLGDGAAGTLVAPGVTFTLQ